MSNNITEKTWSSEIEKNILNKWKEDDITENNGLKNNENYYIIDTPPPYPSGKPWHIGAAAHYSQIDMIARVARSNGFNVLFPIGIDRNGIPVEIYTEKKYKIKMRNVDRKEFLKLCENVLDETEKEFIEILKSLGISSNFNDVYHTDSIDYRTFTQATFIEMWKKGLIYVGDRPNNYCIDCGTTIADSEIIYINMETKLVHVKFFLDDCEEFLTIATTRPELLFACQAIIVNPDDDRYKEKQGKSLKIPLFDRDVKVLPHNSVDPNFGSGVVMVCSYGDLNDVQLFRELHLKEIKSINPNGKTTEYAKQFSNISIKEARKKIVEELQSKNLVSKIESIDHRTPICERSKTPIEIISLEDYYLKQVNLKSDLVEYSKKIKFYPEMHRQILLNWLNSIVIDWPISRRRYYGTEIPIWYCKKCKFPNVPKPGKYYKPWNEDPPFDKCNKCGHGEFEGEQKIFDTWMDSSVSPLYITKFNKNKKFHDATYPNAIRPQGKDIIRTWLYYSMLRCLYLTEQVPWKSAWIMGYGVDDKGEKMSKSKGNVIDPLPIIKKYGADTFRFWSASEANLGYDFRCSEQKILNSQKFLSKLWNIGRFISNFEIMNEVDKRQKLNPTDKWILAELNNMLKKSIEGYNELNFFIPSNTIREFTWNVFASHYIELVKSRIYNETDHNEKKSALYTIHKCFKNILLLLGPICPFITYELWTKIYSNDASNSSKTFPSVSNEYHEMTSLTQKLIQFNSEVWNKKKVTISNITNKPLSLKDQIKITIPDELSLFKRDLIAMHNIIIDETTTKSF